jgi:hypothetical protein
MRGGEIFGRRCFYTDADFENVRKSMSDELLGTAPLGPSLSGLGAV